MKFIHTGRKPPIVIMESYDLKTGKAKFYVDTGADISIIKINSINDKSNRLQHAIRIYRDNARQNIYYVDYKVVIN